MMKTLPGVKPRGRPKLTFEQFAQRHLDFILALRMSTSVKEASEKCGFSKVRGWQIAKRLGYRYILSREYYPRRTEVKNTRESNALAGEIKLPTRPFQGKHNIFARRAQLADRDFAKLRRARQRVKYLSHRVRMNMNPTLENIAKCLPDSRSEFMFYVELAAREDERFKPIAKAWKKLNEVQRRRTDIDSLCRKLLPEVTTAGIIGAAAAVAFKLNYNFGDLIAAVGHRQVVQRSIKEALKPGGIIDRQFHFQHTKYVPTPRGSSVHIFQGMRVDDKEEPSGLPPFETEAIEATNRVRMAQLEQGQPKGPESKG